MTQTLETGKDYGGIFGLSTEKGQQMIYNGGISWTAIQPGKQMTMDSQPMTDKATEYINRPSVHMGM